MTDPIFEIPPFHVEQVLLESQLADRIDWGQDLTQLVPAWAHTKGEGVKVAVLDTGVDMRHATEGDLRGQVLMGRNFTGGDSNDYWDGDSDGQGSHCAGIVAAREDGQGIVGYAPASKLLIGRCLKKGQGRGQWIAEAMLWALDQGADVISMSLGSPDPDQHIGNALERCVAAGAFVVCAAGNTGRPNDVNYPARWKQPTARMHLDNLAIGALGKDGNPAPYSSHGPEVDFVMPGSDVTSCWLRGGYATISGTSMATPAMAGIVALLVSLHRKLGDKAASPLRSHDQLREHLRPHVRDIAAPGRDAKTGWGLPDINRLLDSQVPVPPGPSPLPPGWPDVTIPATVNGKAAVWVLMPKKVA